MSYKIIQHYVGPGKYAVECKFGDFTVTEKGPGHWEAVHSSGLHFTKATRNRAAHAMAAQLSLLYDDRGNPKLTAYREA